MKIPFTQYLLPNGRKRAVTWETTSHEQEIKAQALIDAGAVFEAEILRTKQVSLTCSMKDNSGEIREIAHEICENNEEVVEAVRQLIIEGHKKLSPNQ